MFLSEQLKKKKENGNSRKHKELFRQGRVNCYTVVANIMCHVELPQAPRSDMAFVGKVFAR